MKKKKEGKRTIFKIQSSMFKVEFKNLAAFTEYVSFV
jgi:hypothetical protein